MFEIVASQSNYQARVAALPLCEHYPASFHRTHDFLDPNDFENGKVALTTQMHIGNSISLTTDVWKPKLCKHLQQQQGTSLMTRALPYNKFMKQPTSRKKRKALYKG